MINSNKHINVIIAGGGTGGHIFPAIAIANKLIKIVPHANILFVGANGKMEMEKVPLAGYKILGLDISGLNRSNLLKNIFLPFKIVKSFFQARSIIQQFKPTVCVGVGGYASFPVLYMAQQKGIPTLIQEQNSYAGKSNKVLAKKANAICVAYPTMQKFFPAQKLFITGNPVRENITQTTITKEKALQYFNLSTTKKTVFAFGGSLGAKSINETLASQFKTLIENDIQLIWQTGKNYFETAQQAVKGFEKNIKVLPFIQEMNYAYAAADIIVSRAGASSITELCIVGKPVIFVPYPFASEDHQTHNAQTLVDNNAAQLITDNNAKNDLVPHIIQLLQQPKQIEVLSKNIHSYAITNADELIVNKLIEISK